MNYGNFMPEVPPQKIQILLIYPSPGKLQKKMRTSKKIHLHKFIHNWLKHENWCKILSFGEIFFLKKKSFWLYFIVLL